MKILVVEDEPLLRDFIVESLIDEGLARPEQILQAGDGVEALQVFEREKPRLVITDMMMPRMGGPELIRRIREGKSATEVVIVTGHADVNMVLGAIHLGVHDLLRKPFHASDLLQTVGAVLKKIEGADASREGIAKQVTRDLKEELGRFASEMRGSLKALSQLLAELKPAVKSNGKDYPKLLADAENRVEAVKGQVEGLGRALPNETRKAG